MRNRLLDSIDLYCVDIYNISPFISICNLLSIKFHIHHHFFFEERTTQRQTDNKDTGLIIQIIASPQKNKNKEQLIKDQIFDISLELIQRVVEEV